MKKSILLLYGLIIAIAFMACDKEKDAVVYNGPDMVEFYPVSRSVTTTTNPKLDSFLVQLVGQQRTTAININFEIDPSSTAVVTTDYELLTPAVQIEPGQSKAYIKFRFYKLSAAKTLKISLTGGDNVTASANYKTFTYSLK